MHELSLAGGILKLVEDSARRDGFSRVTRLHVAAGRFSGVEVRALRFALEALGPGTCLEGAELEISEPPGTAWCLPCGLAVDLAGRGDPCPMCDGHQLQVTGGHELKVIDLWVDD